MSDDGHHYSTSRQLRRLTDIGFGGEDPDVGYSARLLFHTMIPHSAQEAREWMRENGRVRVYIEAGAGLGLPYGSYPRLVFVWLVTEAFKTQSRRLVLGDSLSSFMGQLGLLPTGGRWGTIARLRDQMERLFSARLTAVSSSDSGSSRRTMEVGPDYDLWWKPKDPDQTTLWESSVTLGEKFYEQVVSRPFPVDMRVLKAIKRSPLGIDLYTWLTYRVSYMKKPTAISWRQLHEQFGADYGNDKNGRDKFTQAAKRELRKINAAWPALSYETPRGRLLLHPSPPSVQRTLKS